jgi:hypothetical protein
MKIEKLFPRSQFESWLNVQVARHLEARAARMGGASHAEAPELIHAKAYSAKEDMVSA